MAAEIKLTKTDESPWGFRLTGGRDFGTPLTIIKVAVHSVAEEAGLHVGDILVKINDVECSSLTHKEAQDLIIQSNNSVIFSILRGSLSLSDDVIDRLTPLPLREFKTPEPTTQNLINPKSETPLLPAPEPTIEVIPIQDLEPELLEELGLNPLPEDFLEKAKRDPSPMPEVRPSSRMASPIDVLEALEELGLKNVVDDIERQKESVFHPPQPVVVESIPESAPVETSTDAVTEGDVVTNVPAVESIPKAAADFSEQVSTIDPALMQLLPISDLVQPIVIGEQLSSDGNIVANSSDSGVVQPISEEEFAEFMSGKEEVLGVDGKNALGVDFTKFEPKAEFLRKSQVFKTLQDSEHKITREEKDRRWTTFLDKPKGPKPKPRPKPQPHYVNEPPPEPEPAPEMDERKGLYEIPSEEEFEALIRIPTPPPAPVEPDVEESGEQASLEEIENDVKQQLEEEQQNLQQQLEIEKQLNPELFGVEKSEIELQLEEIQRQLQAIQQLPFEIQQHLALVQEQLNQIVQNRLHEEDGSEIPAGPRPSMVDPAALENFEKLGEELPLLEECSQEAEEQNTEKEDEFIEPNIEEVQKEPVEEKKKEFKLRAEEEPAILPPPKKERPRKKRPFLGLGPAPRPLVLPGGRKWRTPKDAYNDEFIAETLSAQAEIITGTTLGVNFRKYEPKPPNLVHLRDSTVYKMIHDLEDPDIVNKGLASRPEIIPALQDYQLTQQSAPAAI